MEPGIVAIVPIFNIKHTNPYIKIEATEKDISPFWRQ